MFNIIKLRPVRWYTDAETVVAFARRPVVLVAAVMALALLAAFVNVLHTTVATGERTRESWRTAEVERVSARAAARDQRALPKR